MYTEDLNSSVDYICNGYYQQEVNIGEICSCHAPSSNDSVHTNYVYTVVFWKIAEASVIVTDFTIAPRIR